MRILLERVFIYNLYSNITSEIDMLSIYFKILDITRICIIISKTFKYNLITERFIEYFIKVILSSSKDNSDEDGEIIWTLSPI